VIIIFIIIIIIIIINVQNAPILPRQGAASESGSRVCIDSLLLLLLLLLVTADRAVSQLA